jgi:hypothetical protein
MLASQHRQLGTGGPSINGVELFFVFIFTTQLQMDLEFYSLVTGNP